MKNDNIKKSTMNVKKNDHIISNRQSAEVNASQRINAKVLWYILGLIEANGNFSCYKEKDHIRAEITIILEENDIKLLYWIRSQLNYGQVKKLYHNSRYTKLFPDKLLAGIIIRSKIFIKNNFLSIFEQYPPLTKNKIIWIKYIKDCLSINKLLPKDFNNINWIRDPESYPMNMNLYIKDWIIGFIEAQGSFYFVNRNDKRIAEFNITQKDEVELLNIIAKEIGLSIKNLVTMNDSGVCVLTVVYLKDIQAIINFMYDSERIRLRGIKKVKFLLWISELRVNPRYSGIKIPIKY